MSACPKESTIAAALRNGELPDELRLHIEGCAACAEAHLAALNLRQMAEGLAEGPCPSAASMWWRLNIRMRREKARRAQAPLIWMARILYAAIAVLVVILSTIIPVSSQPACKIALVAFGAVALPVAIALWGWSRSKA